MIHQVFAKRERTSSISSCCIHLSKKSEIFVFFKSFRNSKAHISHNSISPTLGWFALRRSSFSKEVQEEKKGIVQIWEKKKLLPKNPKNYFHRMVQFRFRFTNCIFPKCTWLPHLLRFASLFPHTPLKGRILQPKRKSSKKSAQTLTCPQKSPICFFPKRAGGWAKDRFEHFKKIIHFGRGYFPKPYIGQFD